MKFLLLSLTLYLATATRQGTPSQDDTYDSSDNPLAVSNNEIDNENPQYVSKRVPSGFFGMRGKKPYDDILLSQYEDDLYKRVPQRGFFGLRGKKEDDFDKRVPSGFFGLRGKKYAEEDLDVDDLDENSFYDKRVPYGFMGLRGKRRFDDVSDEMKRAAPENRFFGMRGKKQPSRSSFFGMRGKKYPYEFRGKFVGVRGKRLNELGAPEFVSSGEAPRYGEDMSLNQLMLLLSEKSPQGQLRE